VGRGKTNSETGEDGGRPTYRIIGTFEQKVMKREAKGCRKDKKPLFPAGSTSPLWAA